MSVLYGFFGVCFWSLATPVGSSIRSIPTTVRDWNNNLLKQPLGSTVRRSLLGCQAFYFVLPPLVSEPLDRIRSRSFNLDRGVAGTSDHRSDIRRYQQLASRNCVLGDCPGCGSYHTIIWCVDPITYREIAPDSCAMPIQRGSRENRRYLRFTRARGRA